jgi:ABC-type amino acid transport substrate-binding protein
MFKKLFSLLMLGLLVSMQSAHADGTVLDRIISTKTINCGYFIWPPYIVKDANTGKFSGINYDIMEAIGKNLGLKINWVAEVGVGDVATALNTDKIDVMCASLWPSLQRTSTITYTMPEFYDVVYAFVRTDDKRFDGDLEKANAKGINVAGIDGDVTADLALEKTPKANHQFLPQTASGAETLMYVATKKADIVFIDEAIVNEFNATNTVKLRKVAGIGPVRIFGEHLTVKKGEYQLRDMLNISLLQLVNDGVTKKLADKYSKQYKSVFIAPDKTVTLPAGLDK